MNWKQYFLSRKEQFFTIFVLLIVSIISFGIFNSKILSSDDWSYFVARYAFGELQPVNISDRRPFVLVLYYALASLFGLQFEYYYFFNFLTLFFSSLLVYAILKRVFPNQMWLPSLVALIYLIYPVDYTRTWIIMIYIRFWWMISLGAIWLLMEFAESGKKWTFVIAMFGILFPLGAYEGQFGTILLASFLIALLTPKITLSRRAMIFGSVIAISFAFLIWRIYFQPHFLHINDLYVGALQFNPAIIIERYIQGFYIFFLGWLKPILTQLKLSGFNLLTWSLLYIFICCVVFIWITVKATPPYKLERRQKRSSARSYFRSFLTGAAFWIAGYFPIIVLYSPSLSGHASRVNSFAIAGASLMLASIIFILAILVANSILAQRLLAIGILLPFIVAGIFVQRQVNKENQLAWEAQKTIWNAVFSAVPDIKDDKDIVIIIPGYQHLRPFETYPFISSWGIEASTQVLYNNKRIGGYYYYENIQDADQQFTKNGFRPLPTNKLISYKNLVFAAYDPQTQSAKLIEDLEERLSLPFTAHNYNPYENISPIQPSTTAFRWLVK